MAESADSSLFSNYDTAENVRARFLGYEAYDSPFDIEIMEIATASMLRLQNILTIVELGSGDGTFIDLLQDYGQRDATEIMHQITGYEPNNNQRQVGQADHIDSALRDSLQELGILTEKKAIRNNQYFLGVKQMQ